MAKRKLSRSVAYVFTPRERMALISLVAGAMTSYEEETDQYKMLEKLLDKLHSGKLRSPTIIKD